MVPAVSVVIPVYNAENTIEKCVESLVLGRMRDLEVILVDDCSRDNSWALCQDFARQYPQIHCIRNDTNRGVSHTRNRGLEQATGEYICFVDSDDWVSEHYAASLLEAARAKPDALVLCGLHFLNRVDDYRRVYLWSQEGEQHTVAREAFFDLHEKFLLPQLWNKIFRREIIENHHLRFDEDQSMGEDFQFVLAYLEASRLQKCLVLDRPLYYYTRTSSCSLMSTFGHFQREAEFARYATLRDLTGAREAYDQALERLKGNFVYHCVRHSRQPKADQLDAIRQIAQDDRAEQHYRALQITRRKEWVVLTVRRVRQRLALIWGDFWRARNRRVIKIAKAKLGSLPEPVTILSQNCIGGVFYKDMDMQFASPTIGAYMSGGDFVRFVSNLEDYLSRTLQMRWGEEYPIGILGDLQIHFMHYGTCRQAREAWQRRCGRINRERLMVLCTDRDGFTDEDFALWKELPYPKVLFTANETYRHHPDSLYFREFAKQGCVGELIPRRKFYRRGKLAQSIKDREMRNER